jgi:hypothetical protein
MDLKKTLNILAINEYEIIGSYSDSNINKNVISDIDTQAIVEFDNKEGRTNENIYQSILKHFQNIFTLLKSNKYITITDFKCGIGNANQPYRWTYRDIMRGYQYGDNNQKIYFIHQLEKHSIIKIDTIIYHNNELIELTMNYYFKYGKNQSFDTKDKKQILTELKHDEEKYKKEGNYYKALKRLNSYYKLKGITNKNLIKKINSKDGIKAKQKSRLETLLYVLNNKTNFSKDIINKVNKDGLNKKQIEDKIQSLNSEINKDIKI